MKKEGGDERVEDEEQPLSPPHGVAGLRHHHQARHHTLYVPDGIHELIPGEVQERHLTLGPAVVVALELPMYRGNQLARYLQRGC